MGGRPLTALAIAGFPQSDFDPAIITAVFTGGFDKLREAGVALLGGHTVRDNEVKFGYAVTGEIDPGRVLSNAGAKPGDVLFLTKAIGTGIVGTAIKAGRAPEAVVQAAVRSMTTLNRAAAEAMRALARRPRSRVHRHHGIRPRRPRQRNGGGKQRDAAHRRRGRAAPHRRAGAREGESARRAGQQPRAFREGSRAPRPAIDQDLLWLMYDPQTSGGLLIAAAPEHAAAVDRALMRAGVAAARIGAACAVGTA